MKFLLPAFYLVAIAFLVEKVSGHGYMSEPLSRNYYANLFGIDWGTEPGRPSKEYCPHCLNTKGPGSVCGTSEQGVNYDVWEDSLGAAMPWNSNANIYGEGDTITVSFVLTTHHNGHAELRACPQGRESTQACFDENVLEFIEDVSYNMPKDEHHPERGYYHARPASEFTMRFKLPDGLKGQQVLLQWTYITANTCNPEGYRDYYNLNFSNSWEYGHLEDCTADQFPPVYFVGDSPERFVNCAEITIVSTTGDNNNENNNNENNNEPNIPEFQDENEDDPDEDDDDDDDDDATSCEDDPTLRFKNKSKRNCNWVKKKASKRCKKKWKKQRLRDYCPVACDWEC